MNSAQKRFVQCDTVLVVRRPHAQYSTTRPYENPN